MSKTNICVIGLEKRFLDRICQKLAEKLDMFYANMDKIIDFEILDLHRMEEVCGSQYVNDEENAIIRRVCSYDNTLINIDYSNLNNEMNLFAVKSNCLLIYLRLSKTRFEQESINDENSKSARLINIDLFEDRNKLCNKNADLIIDAVNMSEDKYVETILLEIYKYYTKNHGE